MLMYAVTRVLVQPANNIMVGFQLQEQLICLDRDLQEDMFLCCDWLMKYE